MPPKLGKPPVEVVQIDSSDDEEDTVSVVAATNSSKSSTPSSTPTPPSPLQSRLPPPQGQTSQLAVTQPAALPRQTLECRSFWKAGDHDVNRVPMKAPPQDLLEHARVHPKFLHSNATSHKWAFGAIAELLDNAVDEIHNGATFVKVDKIDIIKDNSPALVFQDDGGGMSPDSMRKCMSLGYSSKKSNTTIGQCN